MQEQERAELEYYLESLYVDYESADPDNLLVIQEEINMAHRLLEEN